MDLLLSDNEVFYSPTHQVFGEVDEELYEGDLLYTPVVKKWYYEVVITDIAVGGESLNLDCKKVNKIIYPLSARDALLSEVCFDKISNVTNQQMGN